MTFLVAIREFSRQSPILSHGYNLHTGTVEIATPNKTFEFYSNCPVNIDIGMMYGYSFRAWDQNHLLEACRALYHSKVYALTFFNLVSVHEMYSNGNTLGEMDKKE